MGRPTGSTNKSKYHKAGGRRDGAGRRLAGLQRGQTTLNQLFQPSASADELPQTSHTVDAEEQHVMHIDDTGDSNDEASDSINEEADQNMRQQQRVDLVERMREIARENSLLDATGLNSEDGDSDDESIEDYNEDQEDSGIDSATKRQSARTRWGYMPPTGSVLHNYLKAIQEKVVKRVGTLIQHGEKWIVPPMDPVSRPCVGEADLWYESEAWTYIWEPFIQFEGLVKLKDVSCVHCHAWGTYSSNMYSWRPMFYYDKIVWLLHRRFLCSLCKHTCAGIDPRFLSQLPTRVLDRFEFATTSGGHGMHISMIYLFSNLSTKGITYGSFANMINELHRIRYHRCLLSYLDSLYDRKNASEFYQMKDPAPFSSFLGPGEFNGITLSRRTVKTCFFTFMSVHEKYMQAFFQTCVDEAVTADHTHKYSNKITVSGRGGSVFTASYTTMSSSGLVSMSRLTFTKANFELEQVVSDFKTVRENMGQMKLKRFESDNLDGDGRLWKKIFPELDDDVSPFNTTSQDKEFPTAGISMDKVAYISSVTAANNFALAFYQNNNFLAAQENGRVIYYGLDTEWNSFDETTDTTRILQLSFPQSNVAVFNLHLMGVQRNEHFPTNLKSLLQSKYLVPTGRQVGIDVGRLRKLGIKIDQWLELRGLSLRHNADLQGTSLNQLSKRYLGLAINKFGQTEDWSQNPLPDKLIQYAAIDALASRLIAEELLRLTGPTAVTGQETMLEEPKQLKIGEKVHVFLRGSIVANGIVTFVGGAGRTKQWGKKKIGIGCALVHLYEVLLPATKPPILYIASQGDGSWSNNITFGEIISTIDPAEVAVSTSSLLIYLHCDENEPQESDRNYLQSINGEHDATTEEMIESTDENIYLSTIGEETYGSDDDEPNAIRSRAKEDLWHMFDKLPLPRDCPVKQLINQLLIHATWDFVKEDIVGVEEYLKSKDPPVHDMMQHFCFNHEWWKQRVRIYTPKASRHAVNARRVQSFVEENSETKKYCTCDLTDYFNNFARKCEEGKYEELYDVSLFRHIGCDSAGLDLWLRLCGTVRDENLHQKMKTCLGPLGIGARSAHYILVNLCFRYNVSARVRRCGDIDHGHPYLNLVDRIQIRTQDIFNVLLFPQHQNTTQTNFNDFTAVGIGPLCYSEDYVAQGDPLPNLKGDILFIAKQMNLKCPPLPIVSREEIALYSKLMQQKPGPTNQDFCRFAKEFLRNSDGMNIYPKLPSMLQRYYKQWQKNQQIRATKLAIGDAYIELLRSLSSIRVDASLLDEQQEAPEGTAKTPLPYDASLNNDDALFVPPIAGPLQMNYTSTKKQEEQSNRRCYWWPFCGTVDVCNGYKREWCFRFIKGDFCMITEEQLDTAKRDERNKIRRKKYRECQMKELAK